MPQCGATQDYLTGQDFDAKDRLALWDISQTLETLAKRPDDSTLRNKVLDFSDFIGRFGQQSAEDAARIDSAKSLCTHHGAVNALARHMVLSRIDAVYQSMVDIYSPARPVVPEAEAKKAISLLRAIDAFWWAKVMHEIKRDRAVRKAADKFLAGVRSRPSQTSSEGGRKLSLQEINYKEFYKRFYPFGAGKKDGAPDATADYWPSFSEGVDAIWQQRATQFSEAGVTKEEATALIAYTSDWYKVMLANMRGVLDEKQRELLVMTLKLAVSALLKLGEQDKKGAAAREYQQPLIRGDIKRDFLQPRTVGAWYADLGFFSTAMKVDGCYDLWGKDRNPHVITVFKPEAGRTAFEGCGIVSFASYYGAGESEMLFRPGSRFQIVEVIETDTPDRRRGWPALREMQRHFELHKDWLAQLTRQWDENVVQVARGSVTHGHYKLLERVYIVRQMSMLRPPGTSSAAPATPVTTGTPTG